MPRLAARVSLLACALDPKKGKFSSCCVSRARCLLGLPLVRPHGSRLLLRTSRLRSGPQARRDDKAEVAEVPQFRVAPTWRRTTASTRSCALQQDRSFDIGSFERPSTAPFEKERLPLQPCPVDLEVRPCGPSQSIA